MSGKPALIRQRDLKQALLAARKAGAKELRVHLGDDVSMVIPLGPDAKAVEVTEEDPNNSFDKIMRKPGKPVS